MPEEQPSTQVDVNEVVSWLKANEPEVLARAIREVGEINAAFNAVLSNGAPVKKPATKK